MPNTGTISVHPRVAAEGSANDGTAHEGSADDGSTRAAREAVHAQRREERRHASESGSSRDIYQQQSRSHGGSALSGSSAQVVPKSAKIDAKSPGGPGVAKRRRHQPMPKSGSKGKAIAKLGQLFTKMDV